MDYNSMPFLSGGPKLGFRFSPWNKHVAIAVSPSNDYLSSIPGAGGFSFSHNILE